MDWIVIKKITKVLFIVVALIAIYTGYGAYTAFDGQFKHEYTYNYYEPMPEQAKNQTESLKKVQFALLAGFILGVWYLFVEYKIDPYTHIYTKLKKQMNKGEL